MPAHQRKLLKNHFVLRFVPFGGNFNEFEQGKLMEVNGQDAWVIASLGVITADLPQGNDMMYQQHQRYHHITDDQFKEIFDEPATTRQR
ncbi:hypothetical protein RhiirC2_805424 [Rhizophagus irregularis]|uniref:Uncharacterized protein n=1 Tax=Rhizophagus irregularis TaxID=588596 RepID=A0A2N1KU94_9GLOM|nr:hypothetical protein RhiirC2_805424 [Rhizophagus irregularis]